MGKLVLAEISAPPRCASQRMMSLFGAITAGGRCRVLAGLVRPARDGQPQVISGATSPPAVLDRQAAKSTSAPSTPLPDTARCGLPSAAMFNTCLSTGHLSQASRSPFGGSGSSGRPRACRLRAAALGRPRPSQRHAPDRANRFASTGMRLPWISNAAPVRRRAARGRRSRSFPVGVDFDSDALELAIFRVAR